MKSLLKSEISVSSCELSRFLTLSNNYRLSPQPTENGKRQLNR